MIAAVVPVRGFGTGKSRLATVLDDAARRQLVERMAERALAAVSWLDARVMTPDDEVARWAEARGARVVRDRTAGLNACLEEARAEALDEGAVSVLVLFADLPTISAADVQAMLTLAGPTGVCIAPDHTGTGTNALHVGREASLRYRFGPGSFAAHMGQAPQARVVQRPGLARDVDDAATLAPHL